MADFKEIKPQDISDNSFKLIGTDWMLITAGDLAHYNTMTASWGGLGVLWRRNICFCVVRPVRYTYGFMEEAEKFTLSFFDERYKKALEFCGAHSGRDTDKAREAGLTPLAGDGVVYFQEARLVIVGRKIYTHQVDPARFLDPTIEENYPKKDYHRMYIGEIIQCLKKPEGAR